MPLNLHWEEKGALLEVVGKLTFADYHQVLKEALKDRRYDEARYLIFDGTRQLIGSALKQWELEVLAFFTAGIFKERNFIIAAVVNPENQAGVEAAKYYASLASHPHAVFTDIAEARSWVNERLDWI